MKEIAKALVAAQAMLKPALKDSTNPHYKSKYADLASSWEACRDALNKNGLSVIQYGILTPEGPALSTMLLHTSGESIVGSIPLINIKGDMQGLGSAITYARRYGLQAIVGISSEDDDAQAAVEKPRHETIRKPDAALKAMPEPNFDNSEPFPDFDSLPEGKSEELSFEEAEAKLGIPHILKILSQKNQKGAAFYASVGEGFEKYKKLTPKQKDSIKNAYDEHILGVRPLF